MKYYCTLKNSLQDKFYIEIKYLVFCICAIFKSFDGLGVTFLINKWMDEYNESHFVSICFHNINCV